jgi:CRP-like cAMP-binding protein
MQIKNNIPDPRQNEVLENLIRVGQQSWMPHLEPVDLAPGLVLYDVGRESDYVYFPVTARVSLLYLTANGDSTEIAAIDRQGIVGIGLLLGGAATPVRAVVRTAGTGFRLRAQMFREEVNRGSPAMDVVLRYVQALVRQMAQSVGKMVGGTGIEPVTPAV